METDGGTIESSLQVSGVIANVPAVEIGLIFAKPDLAEKAKSWVDAKVRELLK